MSTFDVRIAQYVQLRDMIKAEDDAHKEKMKPKREILEQLNNVILSMLQSTGQDSAKTAAGTAYRKEKKSATIADAATFRRHVIGTEDYDLIDWRANSVAVAAYIDKNDEAPPGINFTTTFDVGVRRGS